MSQHYHFIGIGGMGMGTLASIMLAKGARVSGSDVKESRLTRQLREEGATISIGHQPDNVESPDFVIYSSAVTRNNPEMQAAEKKKIHIQKRAQLLAELVNCECGITVAGAHGKTTTTSMISHCLIKAGLNPTTAIGGIINGGTYNATLGAGKYFVAEVDESDGSFLFFRPFYSVVTNIDFEHLDYYHNWENILAAYRQFIRQTQPSGCVIAFGDDERLQAILAKEKIRTLTFGLGKHNRVSAQSINLDGFESTFDCSVEGKIIGRFRLKVPGQHNVLNALACITVGLELLIDPAVLVEALNEFQGVERRFQTKANINDILVIEDYGHHPTEIVSTLKTAKTFRKKRVITVFQPHRYSRTKYLMDEFVSSLALSDYLILTDIYAASEKPLVGVNSQILNDKIKEKVRTPVYYLKKEAILKHLKKIVGPGDLIVFLGAGDINRIGDEFVQTLIESSAQPAKEIS